MKKIKINRSVFIGGNAITFFFFIMTSITFADILVENKIILELKVANHLENIHKAQLLNYLQASKIKVGYLLNFGNLERLEFQRLVY